MKSRFYRRAAYVFFATLITAESKAIVRRLKQDGLIR